MKGKKTGGRTKGTPNRQTQINNAIGRNLQKDGILPLLQYLMFGGEIPSQLENSEVIKFLAEVDSRDALAFTERLMQYIVPKMQSTTMDLTADLARRTIEDTLADLAEDNEP